MFYQRRRSSERARIWDAVAIEFERSFGDWKPLEGTDFVIDQYQGIVTFSIDGHALPIHVAPSDVSRSDAQGITSKLVDVVRQFRQH